MFISVPFKLENLTTVSSNLRTKVAASREKSEELLNKTLARDTNLQGKINPGSYIESIVTMFEA